MPDDRMPVEPPLPNTEAEHYWRQRELAAWEAAFLGYVCGRLDARAKDDDYAAYITRVEDEWFASADAELFDAAKAYAAGTFRKVSASLRYSVWDYEDCGQMEKDFLMQFRDRKRALDRGRKGHRKT